MVTVLYFASLRETLACREEVLAELPPDVETVGALREWLCARAGVWTALRPGQAIRAAINQELAQPHGVIRDGDEVAFFPPVTGG